MAEGYAETYARWQADPEAFWLEAAGAVDWVRAPVRALDASRAPFYDWFPDTRVNGCWNAVDRHVAAGHGERTAILHDSAASGEVQRISYAALKDRVARLAGALAAEGVGLGDRVILYMPMVPEAIEGMLACARIGAIHSVVFGGFAAAELAKRIDAAEPVAILAGSCGIESGRVIAYKPLVDAAIAAATHKPRFTVILQRDAGPAALAAGDREWAAFRDGGTPVDCVPVPGNHPAYILYTSGTTGAPKGVVRPTAGHIVALLWSMRAVYDVHPGEVFWAASDVGWVVGHSYICYAPLFAGCTTVMFEGKPVGTPDAGAYWRVMAEHRVAAFFAAPTAMRAIKREDRAGEGARRYDLAALRTVFLAGERADPDTVAWVAGLLGKPVVDHWWQTETGWAIAANPLGLGGVDAPTGSPGVPMPGYTIDVLNEAGAPVPPGTLGALAIRLPLPPGALATLWTADARFEASYLAEFPGYYATGDAGMLDAEGHVFVMARTDDVINVAGHRLSTGAMEEILATHPDVAECAVIGIADPVKGHVPVGFVCLNRGASTPRAEISAACVALVRTHLGPVAAFRRAVVVDRLPKTRSGKTLRAAMARVIDGDDGAAPASIDDPAILREIKAAWDAG